jgi:hypothetical protein
VRGHREGRADFVITIIIMGRFFFQNKNKNSSAFLFFI